MANIINDDFLNLLERTPNEEQKNAIRQQKNCVVAAGAGSGKTQVLASRFAWLVLTGTAKADEILTLTYTNKAASEMYQRIYQTLVFFSSKDELTPEQKKRIQQGLEDFSNAHIQTLDSYCSAILRQCANRYGIKPDFGSGTSGTKDIRNQILRFILAHAKDSCIQFYSEPGQLQNFAENTVFEILDEYTSLATKDGFFTEGFSRQKAIVERMWNYITGDTDSDCDDFKSIKENVRPFQILVSEVIREHSENMKNFGKPYYTATQKFLDYYNSLEFNAITPEEFETLISLQQFANNLTGYSKPLQAATKALRTVFPVYNSVISFRKNQNNLAEFYSLMDELLTQINRQKRSSGTLSFKDVSEMTLKVLLENPDIRNQERKAYKKIMIDEFQDNNSKNRDLLYLISLKTDDFTDDGTPLISQIIRKNADGSITEDLREEEKLFFVGDEKQSIYKFRGADVQVFNELTSTGENEILEMNCNFRSVAPLLSGFNNLFHNGNGIFEDWNESNPRKEFEAYYGRDALKHGSELPQLNSENTKIHICLANKKTLDENDRLTEGRLDFIPAKEQVAFNMAKKIWETGKDKENWNDFAILDRSRTDRNIITKYLNLFRIPYSVDSSKNIFSEAIVNDFYNFLRLCIYPSDVNAFAAFICSPFCGLSEQSAEKIISHLTDITNRDYIFDPFANSDLIRNDLSAEDFTKLQNGLEFYKSFRPEVLKQKLTSTLSVLWNKTGYHYETYLNQNTSLLSEHFDMLFELSRQTDDSGNGVAWFIDELAKLKSRWSTSDSEIDTGDIAYPIERSSSVKIMTIHKSKGLQFAHVFIYGCTGYSPKGNGNKNYDEETLFSMPAEAGAANIFVDRYKDLETARSIAEFRRLVYVAVTRAEQDVYITGVWNPVQKQTGKCSFFEQISQKFYSMYFTEETPLGPSKIVYEKNAPFDFENIPLVQYSDINSLNIRQNMDDLRAEKLYRSQLLKDLPATEFICHPIERSTPSSLETEDGQIENAILTAYLPDDNKPLVSDKFTAADFGTLAHAYLEFQANGNDSETFDIPSALIKNLTEAEIAANKKSCLNFCENFKKSEFGQELEDARTNGRFFKAEWEFKLFNEGKIWHGSIDLIYQTSDGNYRIVDYKSDSAIDAEKYKGQQNCYRTAAARMLNVDESKIDCQLYFMRFDSTEKIERKI